MAAKVNKSKKTYENRYEGILKDLEKQRSLLLAEAGETISGGLNPSTQNLPDMSDQASVEADQFFLLRLREREQKLLQKIDDALERFTKGTFGVCESCRGEIAFKRLKARPVTALCIDCKTKQEEEEKVRESS